MCSHHCIFYRDMTDNLFLKQTYIILSGDSSAFIVEPDTCSHSPNKSLRNTCPIIGAAVSNPKIVLQVVVSLMCISH